MSPMSQPPIKGIILAGGLGSRLHPLTKITNKHLLPVFDQPMIHYPIKTLVNAGIKDILIVTGGNHAGDFLRLLGNGNEFGLKHINYTYQEGEGGIADALRLAEHFCDGDPMCVVLGDNIIQNNIRAAAEAYRQKGSGARILLSRVPDPERFGVARFAADDGPPGAPRKIVELIEKPENPPSDCAVIGVYFFDSWVFDIIRTLKPSKRNELEITEVNNAYLRAGLLEHSMLDGWWTDAGTFDSLLRASNLVKSDGANNL